MTPSALKAKKEATEMAPLNAEQDGSHTFVHLAVVTASMWSYRAGGEEVMQAQDLNVDGCLVCPDILLPGLRRAEQVLTEETLESFDESSAEALREAGYDLWALVPLAVVGRAQERLRGAVDRIQPWWVDDDLIRFGEPRLA